MPPFSTENKVGTFSKNIGLTRPSTKLDYQYFSSAETTKYIQSVKFNLHHVFHVSFLEDHAGTFFTNHPFLPTWPAFRVMKNTKHWIQSRFWSRLYYQVDWEGYGLVYLLAPQAGWIGPCAASPVPIYLDWAPCCFYRPCHTPTGPMPPLSGTEHWDWASCLFYLAQCAWYSVQGHTIQSVGSGNLETGEKLPLISHRPIFWASGEPHGLDNMAPQDGPGLWAGGWALLVQRINHRNS